MTELSTFDPKLLIGWGGQKKPLNILKLVALKGSLEETYLFPDLVGVVKNLSFPDLIPNIQICLSLALLKPFRALRMNGCINDEIGLVRSLFLSESPSFQAHSQFEGNKSKIRVTLAGWDSGRVSL